jgi:ketosteroid isomerase-like protein
MFKSAHSAATLPVSVRHIPRPNQESSMSRESVDVAQRCIDAYNQRDLEALLALSDPDLELDWSAPRGWFAGMYRGIAAVLRFYMDYFDVFEEIILEPDYFMDAGGSVVVPNVSRLRGREGIQVVARSALVFTVRSHKVTRICLYQETEHALEAVGLPAG